MTNALKELRDQNKTAYVLLIEFLSFGRRFNEFKTTRKFVEHLLTESIRLGIERANVNEIFRFIQWGAYRFVIPRSRESGGEFLLLNACHSRLAFAPEALEADEILPSIDFYLVRGDIRGKPAMFFIDASLIREGNESGEDRGRCAPLTLVSLYLPVSGEGGDDTFCDDDPFGSPARKEV